MPEPLPRLSLGTVDLMVIGLYLAATLTIGYATRKVAPTLEDYLLAGRRLTLPLFVATLVSTWYGGILGVGEIAFSAGLVNWLTQGWFWYLAYLLFAALLAGRLRRSMAITLPDQLERLYGREASILGAVFNYLNVLPVAYVLSLGLLLQLFFNLSLPLGILAGALVVLLYSFRGGFRADVYTDLLQFGLMCTAVAALIPFAVHELGGAEYLRRSLPAGHLSWRGGWSLQEVAVWFVIAMATLIDPNFYQRCYAAASPRVARRGILLAVGFWCLFDVCTTFGGLYARAALPEAPPTWGYPLLADRLLPAGLRGLFFAGCLATVMSTVDSFTLVAAGTLGRDLYGKVVRPQARDPELVRATRAGMVVTVILATGLALIHQGSIRAVWKSFGSLSAGALLVPVLAGLLLPGRRRPAGGLWSIAAGGGTTALALMSAGWTGRPPAGIEPLFLGLIASAVTLAAFELREVRR